MKIFSGYCSVREPPKLFHDYSKLEQSYELIGGRISIRDTLETAVQGYYNFRLYKRIIIE